MNTNVIGYWNGKKEKLKQIYPTISDEDLNFQEGKEKEMMEMLGYKLGKTREELNSIISSIK
ncbi:MAG: general stress protein CsbD [Bacteroidales bacterium]|nr:MAG: general stress protein CsbD [Bacteroidales bacterium]